MDDALFELFFESMLGGAAILDRNFNLLRVNRAFADACRESPAALVGRMLFDLYPGDFESVFHECIRTRQPQMVRANPYVFPGDPDRGVTYWDWNLVPVTDNRGEVERLLFCLDEITEHRRAQDSLRHASSQLRKLAAAVVEAREAECRRIALILHDEVSQDLTGVRLLIENSIEQAGPEQSPRTREALDAINSVLTRIRNIAVDLRLPVLDDLGLVPALLWLADHFRALSGLQVEFKHEGIENRLPRKTETAAFFIAKEALNNAALHARVRDVSLTVLGQPDSIMMRIEDKGQGFDLDATINNSTSLGLFGMQQRARVLNGRVTIETVRGMGTTVTVDLPLTARHDAS